MRPKNLTRKMGVVLSRALSSATLKSGNLSCLAHSVLVCECSGHASGALTRFQAGSLIRMCLGVGTQKSRHRGLAQATEVVTNDWYSG